MLISLWHPEILYNPNQGRCVPEADVGAFSADEGGFDALEPPLGGFGWSD